MAGEKLYRLLYPTYHWPGMHRDCVQYVAKCFECQISAGRPHGSWQGKLLPLPPGPRCEWSVDLITALGPPLGPKHHLLTAICCFSKFCVLTLIPDKSSHTITTALHGKVFAAFGWPAAVRSDNGTEFRGEFDMLCTAHNIKHKRTSPYTSHSNSAVERLHRTIEDLLRRCLVTLPHAAWPTLIPELQLTINTTYARSVGCAPYLIMFSATPPTHIHHLPDPTTTTVK